MSFSFFANKYKSLHIWRHRSATSLNTVNSFFLAQLKMLEVEWWSWRKAVLKLAWLGKPLGASASKNFSGPA